MRCRSLAIVLVLLSLFLLTACTFNIAGLAGGQTIITKEGDACVKHPYFYFYGGTITSSAITGCTTKNYIVDGKEVEWCATKTSPAVIKDDVGEVYLFGTKLIECKNPTYVSDGYYTDNGCVTYPWYFVKDGKVGGPYFGCNDLGNGKEECAASTVPMYFENQEYNTEFGHCPEKKDIGRDLTRVSTQVDKSGRGVSTGRDLTKGRQPDLGKDTSRIDTRFNREQKYLAEQGRLAACFKNNCYDTDGQLPGEEDGSDFMTAGKVYKTVPYGPQHAGKDVVQEGNLVCETVSDYCKGDNILVEQVCKFDFNNKVWQPGVKAKKCECGCNPAGKCQECVFPDLQVEMVPDAISKKCANSFTALICNKGNGPVEDEFKVTITANKITRTFNFPKNRLPELNPGQCTLIEASQLFHIGGYGLKLKQKVMVDVEVDSDNDVKEKLEFNNKKTKEAYTGDEYYYDGNTICDAFCYDTDTGFYPFTYGDLTYSYSGQISSKQDICYNDLFAWWDDEHTMREHLCTDIYMKNNQKLSNPLNFAKFDCLSKKPYGRCNEGVCEELKKEELCSDSSGNQVPCLKCVDLEGASNKQKKDYKNLDDYQIINDKKVVDPFSKGTIDHTTLDNVNTKQQDYCHNNNLLIDLTCQQGVAAQYIYSEKNSKEISCYKIKTAIGKGHKCDGGVCVLTDVDKEKCVGPKKKELDPLKKQQVEETLLLGEKIVNIDKCISEDTVQEYYCKLEYPEFNKWYWDSQDTNCDYIKDKNGKGASCVDGACVFFDKSKEKCTESKDIGPDYKKYGEISYTTGYGYDGFGSDKCKDENTLIESYCFENKPQFFDHTCKKEAGLFCDKGACKSKDLSKMTCTEKGDTGSDAYTPGNVKGIDEFGSDYWWGDYCIKKGKSVVEYSCDGKAWKKDEVDCKPGDVCKKGACRMKDDKNLACSDHDGGKIADKGSWISFVDEYGVQVNEADKCESDTKVKEWYCESKKPAFISLSCKQGEKCIKDQCVSASSSKESCSSFGYGSSSGEWGSGITVKDQYGKPTDYHSKCSDDKTTNIEWSCDGKKAKKTETVCKKDEQCKANKCRKFDEKQVSCKEVGDYGSKDAYVKGGVKAVDAWGIDVSNQDYCSGSYAGASEGPNVMEAICKDKKADFVELKCKDGEKCFNGACRKKDEKNIQCFDLISKGLDTENYGISVAIDAYGFDYGEGDECDGFDIIEEAYCDKDKEVEIKKMKCPTGKLCVNDLGQCMSVIKETKGCKEFGESGVSPNIIGSVVTLSDEDADWCVGKNEVKDYFCTADGKIDSKNVKCKTGEICAEGACQKDDKSTFSCKEYLDTKHDASTFGFVVQSMYGYTKPLQDKCDSNILDEFACDGNMFDKKEIKCADSGKICSEGKCV